MKTTIRIFWCAWLIFDAAFIDIWFDKTRYQKNPRGMTWSEFWDLTEIGA